MPHLYLDKRKCPPVWRYQVWDAAGRRKTYTGTTSKRETAEIAQRRQVFEREVQDGVRPRPQPPAPDLDFSQTVEEYLCWGKAQGGHHGHPWNWMHGRRVVQMLGFWKDKLKLVTLGSLKGCLPRVERVLRDLRGLGRTGKTINHYGTTLSAFCNWCVTRGYMEANPLKALAAFDSTPRTTRRALTAEEVQKLLEVAETHFYGRMRRLGYEVAICSGLRKGEIRALRVKHLDMRRGGLVLDAAWTKNRRPGFQPLPLGLLTRLAESASEKDPEDSLVYMGTDPARGLQADLKRAGISKWTSLGKVDFHSLRVSYVTFVVESGADLKTAQTLARHSTPVLTMNIYARARQDRLSEAVEAVGRAVQAGPTAAAASRSAITHDGDTASADITRAPRVVQMKSA